MSTPESQETQAPVVPLASIQKSLASYRVLAWGLMPVGAALAGPIAGATSLGTVLLGAAVIVATTAVVLGGPLLRTGGPGQAPRGSDI